MGTGKEWEARGLESAGREGGVVATVSMAGGCCVLSGWIWVCLIGQTIEDEGFSVLARCLWPGTDRHPVPDIGIAPGLSTSITSGRAGQKIDCVSSAARSFVQAANKGVTRIFHAGASRQAARDTSGPVISGCLALRANHRNVPCFGLS
jgi:hypothetical protein